MVVMTNVSISLNLWKNMVVTSWPCVHIVRFGAGDREQELAREKERGLLERVGVLNIGLELVELLL